MKEPKSILIFRNGSIGNTLAALPAIYAIRLRYPQAVLSVIVDSIGYEMLEQCAWIDHLVSYDKRGKDKSMIAQFKLILMLRRLKPTHALLFKRFFRNGLLAFLSGAGTRLGFATDGKAPFLTQTIPYDETISVYDLNMQLAELFLASRLHGPMEIPINTDDRLQANALLSRRNIADRNYIVAHYGGKTTAPDFIPVIRFADVIKSINTPTMPVLLIGSGSFETQCADHLRALIPTAVLVCNLPIRTMSAIIQTAHFFVGFNSGPAHIAAMFRIPELVIFRSDQRVNAEIQKWLPPIPTAHALIPPNTSHDSSWQRFNESAVVAHSAALQSAIPRAHDA